MHVLNIWTEGFILICMHMMPTLRIPFVWMTNTILLDCVLKASAINCWSIYPVDPQSTLHRYLGWHLTKTRLALNQHFNRHSINSWLIVGRESTNSYVLIDTCSMEYLEKLVLRLSTDCWLIDCVIVWGVDGVSIKGWWRILVDTWPWLPVLHTICKSRDIYMVTL